MQRDIAHDFGYMLMFIYLHIEELAPKCLDYPWYVATVSRLPTSAELVLAG